MNNIIKNDIIEVEIKSLGAELFKLKKGNKNYIWDVDSKYWDKTSPILFPIVGQLRNDKYTYNRQEYSLPRHGFARNQNFEIIESSQSKIIFSLKSSQQTKINYPFDFELQIGYILDDNKLKISYQIYNTNNDSILPFSIGAHPAFSLEDKIESYSLEFDTNNNLKSYQLQDNVVSENIREILLTDNKLNLDYDLFKNDAIILKNNSTKTLTLLHNNHPQIKVSFSDFPFLGIWTKQDAPFICIEPWLGIADSTNSNGNILDKEGILILNPNQNFKTEYEIEIYD